MGKSWIYALLTLFPVSVMAVSWHDAAEAPFTTQGRWNTPDTPVFQRLPANGKFSDHHRALGRNSAGVQVRFRTDSPVIAVRVKLEASGAMCHIPATGQSGVDLYVGAPGFERYCATSIFDPAKPEYEVELFRTEGRKMRDYVLYLPLYNTVTSLQIGLEENAALEASSPYPAGVIVFFGTSITQGGCASRPGMAHTNILSRRLGRELYNFGFSSGGTLDASLAELLAKIPDPVLYVIECENNCPNALLEERLKLFIVALRTAHSDVPVLVVSALPGPTTNSEAVQIQRRIVDEAGDGVFFLDGRTLLPGDPGEYTVDGTHLTTLGFQNYAEALLPHIKEIMR